jgi:transposase
VGNDREEHVFALTQAVELYDTYQAKIVGCDARIEAILKRLQKAASTPVSKPPPARSTKQQSNGLAFDVRGALHGLLGCDLTQIHGLGPYLALKLVGECGTDLSAWPTSKHFTSWLCLAPIVHHVEVQSHEPVNWSVTPTGHGLRLPGIEYVRDDAFA